MFRKREKEIKHQHWEKQYWEQAWIPICQCFHWMQLFFPICNGVNVMPTLGKTVTCQHDIIFQSESQTEDLVFFAGAISMLKQNVSRTSPVSAAQFAAASGFLMREFMVSGTVNLWSLMKIIPSGK